MGEAWRIRTGGGELHRLQDPGGPGHPSDTRGGPQWSDDQCVPIAGPPELPYQGIQRSDGVVMLGRLDPGGRLEGTDREMADEHGIIPDPQDQVSR